MKSLILSIAITSISSCLFSQMNSHRDTINLSENPKNNMYILDSSKSFRSIAIFKMDEPDCYLQIIDGVSVMSYRFRGKNGFHSGKIYNPEIVVNEGDTIRAFTLISDNTYPITSIGTRTYIGILENKNANPTIYILNKRYQIEKLFISHIATKEELEKLYARSDEQKLN